MYMQLSLRSFNKITNLITIPVKLAPLKALFNFLLSHYHVVHMQTTHKALFKPRYDLEWCSCCVLPRSLREEYHLQLWQHLVVNLLADTSLLNEHLADFRATWTLIPIHNMLLPAPHPCCFLSVIISRITHIPTTSQFTSRYHQTTSD
jgi:hypothetical protein